MDFNNENCYLLIRVNRSFVVIELLQKLHLPVYNVLDLRIW